MMLIGFINNLNVSSSSTFNIASFMHLLFRVDCPCHVVSPMHAMQLNFIVVSSNLFQILCLLLYIIINKLMAIGDAKYSM